MPEIKRNFIGGKMNKDLDERFIVSGEYKDAMNVQVSTSEQSDVFTVQNILGNSLGCTYTGADINPIVSGSTTVGSVADEKNDSLYWLVSGIKGSDTLITGQTISTFLQPYFYPNIPLPPDDPNASPLTYTSRQFKDIIMRTNTLKPQRCEPVFVDVYRILTYNDNVGISENNIALYDESVISNISVGMEVNGWNAGGSKEWSTVVTGVGNIETIPLYYQSPIDHVDPAVAQTPFIATSDISVFGLGYGYGWGCTDPLAGNYNAGVVEDDGSCSNTGGSGSTGTTGQGL